MNGVGCLTEQTYRALQEKKIRLWKWLIDYKQVSKVGRLSYSTRMHEETKISYTLSKVTKKEIGVHWRLLLITINYARKKSIQQAQDTNNIVRAPCK